MPRRTMWVSAPPNQFRERISLASSSSKKLCALVGKTKTQSVLTLNLDKRGCPRLRHRKWSDLFPFCLCSVRHHLEHGYTNPGVGGEKKDGYRNRSHLSSLFQPIFSCRIEKFVHEWPNLGRRLNGSNFMVQVDVPLTGRDRQPR